MGMPTSIMSASISGCVDLSISARNTSAAICMHVMSREAVHLKRKGVAAGEGGERTWCNPVRSKTHLLQHLPPHIFCCKVPPKSHINGEVGDSHYKGGRTQHSWGCTHLLSCHGYLPHASMSATRMCYTGVLAHRPTIHRDDSKESVDHVAMQDPHHCLPCISKLHPAPTRPHIKHIHGSLHH